MANEQTKIIKVTKSELRECDLNTDVKGKIIVEGFVDKQKFIDVQLNLKRWQEVSKAIDASDQLQGILKVLTGFK